MIAFDPMDHTASQVLHVVDLRHQLFIRIRNQQIGGWDRPVVLVPQCVDQLIDCAGRLDLGIQVGVLAQQRERFPIKDHLGIGKSAFARQVNFIRAIEN